MERVMITDEAKRAGLENMADAMFEVLEKNAGNQTVTWFFVKPRVRVPCGRRVVDAISD